MTLRSVARLLRSLMLLVVAIALDPSSVVSQSARLAGCYAPQGGVGHLRVLTAQRINLWNRSADQTIQTCASWCLSGTVPPGDPPVQREGDAATFRPPYSYTALSGGVCFCGRTIENAAPVDDAACRSPLLQIYALGQTGAGGGVGAAAPAPPTGGPPPGPPPPVNRAPNAPAVPAGGWEPPFPMQYEGAIQLTWTNNGDPDNDRLKFGLFIFQYDFPRREWVGVPGLRDWLGNSGAVWVDYPLYTFTIQDGLRPDTYYSWIVCAWDEKAPCVFSSWSWFRTQ